MVSYCIRRFIFAILLLSILSVSTFIIIQMPAGDYLSTYIMNLRKTGRRIDKATVAALRKRYGLDLPIHVQYFKWIWKVFHGDFGMSFAEEEPVSKIIAERLPVTVMISLFSLAFTYLVAIPIGIYSATHQYSIADYVFTIIGFGGLATPNFLLGLLLLVFFLQIFWCQS